MEPIRYQRATHTLDCNEQLSRTEERQIAHHWRHSGSEFCGNSTCTLRCRSAQSLASLTMNESPPVCCGCGSGSRGVAGCSTACAGCCCSPENCSAGCCCLSCRGGCGWSDTGAAAGCSGANASGAALGCLLLADDGCTGDAAAGGRCGCDRRCCWHISAAVAVAAAACAVSARAAACCGRAPLSSRLLSCTVWNYRSHINLHSEARPCLLKHPSGSESVARGHNGHAPEKGTTHQPHLSILRICCLRSLPGALHSC